MSTGPVRINFLPTALIVLALVVLAFFLDSLMSPLLWFVLGVILAIVLYPIVRFLRNRAGMPHIVAVAVTVLLFFAVIIGLLIIVVPAVAREAQNLQQLLTQLRQNPQQVEFIDQIPGLSRLIGPEQLQSLVEQLTAGPSALAGRAVDFATRILEPLAHLFFAFLTMVFVLGGARELTRGAVRVTPERYRDPLTRTLARLLHDVGVWGLLNFTMAVVTGILAWLGFTLVGVQNAALYGVIQGVGELIPDVGPIVAGAIVVLSVLVTSPQDVVWVIAISVGVQVLQAFIAPVVYGHTIEVHPAWIVLGILLLGTAFGVIGALLAVPILATLKIIAEEFYVKQLPEVDQDRLDKVLSGRAARRR